MGEAKVHFLHQEELLECLRQAMEQKLAGANQSRTFYSQVILPDMDFGTPETTTTTAAAGTSSKNPGDRGDASPDTEGPTPPEGSGGGCGASASQRLSSRRSPPAPRNVGLEAMVESDEGDEEEAGGDAGSSSGEGGQAARGSGSGRKRGRAGVPALFSPFQPSSQPGGSNKQRGQARGGGSGRSSDVDEDGRGRKAKRGRTNEEDGDAAAAGGAEGPAATEISSSEEEEGEEEEEGDVAKRGRTNEEDGDAAAAGGAEGPAETEISSSEDEEGEGGEEGDVVMCVCPEPDVGQSDNVGQEEEEGKCSASVATSGDRSQEKPSAGNGTGGAVAAEAERPDEEKTPQTKPSSNNKQNKMKPSKRKKQAKPFAGISKLGGPHQNCNCCGGRAPRGPDGSIVLTQGAGATGGSSSSSGTPGDGIDGVPYRGTPSSQDSSSSSQAAAVRAQQQHRRPDTFVETSVKYNSVRSLIADFKTQASETGLKPEGRGGGSRGDFRLCVEACSWLCAHKGLTQMLRKYSFVGMVDLHLSLLQFNTKLVLVNHTALR
ncbi:unnamed protein product [Ectocarpus sp. CCAP 1310/34]|nr:unnamed protein product [Ectocarpus sp. CCAP 1310/34]